MIYIYTPEYFCLFLEQFSKISLRFQSEPCLYLQWVDQSHTDD